MPCRPTSPAAAPTDARDLADYQTVYAREDGSVAAPDRRPAFHPDLLAALAGARRVALLRHAARRRRHLPAGEGGRRRRAPDACRARRGQRRDRGGAERRARAGGRIVAVGTTALRLLESAADEAGSIGPFAGETAIFITPGYRFRAVDVLMTNFHLPRSTLFMLV